MSCFLFLLANNDENMVNLCYGVIVFDWIKSLALSINGCRINLAFSSKVEKMKTIANDTHVLSRKKLDKAIIKPWSMLALAFGLCSILMIVDLIVSRKAEERAYIQSADNVIDLSLETLSQAIKKSDVILKLVISNSQNDFDLIQSAPNPDVDSGRVLSTVLARNAAIRDEIISMPDIQIESLRIISQSGNVVFQSSDSLKPGVINVRDKNYFKFHEENPKSLSQVFAPVKLAVSGRWAIPVTRKIVKPDGSFNGVAILLIRADYFDGIFSRSKIGNDSSFSMVALDGGLITRSPALSKEVDGEFDVDKMMRMITSGEIGGIVSSKSVLNNEQYTLKYKTSGVAPFVFIAAMSPDDIYRHWNRKAQFYGLTLALCLSMLFGLQRIFNQRKVEIEEALKLSEINDQSIKSIANLNDRQSAYFETLAHHSKLLSDFAKGDHDVSREELYLLSYKTISCINILRGMMAIDENSFGVKVSDFNPHQYISQRQDDISVACLVKNVAFSAEWTGGKNGKYNINSKCFEECVNWLMVAAARNTSSGFVSMCSSIDSVNGLDVFNMQVKNSGYIAASNQESMNGIIESNCQLARGVRIEHLGLSLAVCCLNEIQGALKLDLESSGLVSFSVSIPLGQDQSNIQCYTDTLA